MEMFVFQRPRFARATHVRNLDLTSQGQKELLEAGFIIGDTNILMKTYYRQVYPDILLTRKYMLLSSLKKLTKPYFLLEVHSLTTYFENQELRDYLNSNHLIL